jgi:hypothetical protein
MSLTLLLGIVVLGVVFLVGYARTVIRVDAPVNPSGVAIIRRRHDRWLARGQNGLRYIVGIVIGLAVVWGVVRPNLSSGRTVGVSSQASRSPVRGDVVSTMNDYFADFDTGPVCRYSGAFSEPLRPPTTLADCKSTLDSTPKVQHITVGPHGSVNVQVTFMSRRKAAAGQRPDACTKWTVAFRMNREGGQLRIAEPPAFRGTPTKC